jgi:hypothetical protein
MLRSEPIRMKVQIFQYLCQGSARKRKLMLGGEGGRIIGAPIYSTYLPGMSSWHAPH